MNTHLELSACRECVPWDRQSMLPVRATRFLGRLPALLSVIAGAATA